MSSDLCDLGLTEAATLVASGRASAREWMESCIRRIDALEPLLAAWACFDRDYALKGADEVDRRIQSGGPRIAPFYGAPVGIKDIINTRDLPTRHGSPIFQDYMPGNNARVVDRVLWRGGVIAGKTVTAEFAVHHPGPTVNPHDVTRTPGTSSSGSAVAVAARMVPMALGTQTLGSTIRPASYVGTYAFKPTFGLIPRTGILKTTDSLDQVGYFCHHPADLRPIFENLKVEGGNYPFSEDMVRRDVGSEPFRVNFVRTASWAHASDYARAAVEGFVRTLSTEPGIEVVEEELPADYDQSWDLHDRIYTKALSYYFQREFELAPEQISPSMTAMVERGRAVSADQYREAMQRQVVLARTLTALFDDRRWDCILTLSAAGEAPVGLDAENDPDNLVIWTTCQVPVAHLPLFRGPNGLPFGLQVVGRKYGDYRLLRFVDSLHARGMLPMAPNPAIDCARLRVPAAVA